MAGGETDRGDPLAVAREQLAALELLAEGLENLVGELARQVTEANTNSAEALDGMHACLHAYKDAAESEIAELRQEAGHAQQLKADLEGERGRVGKANAEIARLTQQTEGQRQDLQAMQQRMEDEGAVVHSLLVNIEEQLLTVCSFLLYLSCPCPTLPPRAPFHSPFPPL